MFDGKTEKTAMKNTHHIVYTLPSKVFPPRYYVLSDNRQSQKEQWHQP